MPSESRFLFLLASPREAGNSELLARHAASFLPADTQQRWLRLSDYALPPFQDLRHAPAPGAYPTPEGAAATLLEATLWATDIVVAAPLYWYALPAPAKLYFDHWSGWMRVPNLDFRPQMSGKTLRGIVSSSGDAPEAQPLHDMLRLTADYMRMTWGGLLLGNGSAPGDIRQDATAWQAAKNFF
jgi:multimeric flavodoxin WrbA